MMRDSIPGALKYHIFENTLIQYIFDRAAVIVGRILSAVDVVSFFSDYSENTK